MLYKIKYWIYLYRENEWLLINYSEILFPCRTNCPKFQKWCISRRNFRIGTRNPSWIDKVEVNPNVLFTRIMCIVMFYIFCKLSGVAVAARRRVDTKFEFYSNQTLSWCFIFYLMSTLQIFLWSIVVPKA